MVSGIYLLTMCLVPVLSFFVSAGLFAMLQQLINR
jgi:hypothetical protein